MKVTIDGTTIAESNDTIVVEGNHYFPPSSVVDKDKRFTSSDTQYTCPWKGETTFYNIVLPDGKEIKDGAWAYPNPKEAAKNITGYVAFYKNKVTIAE
ncbi:hypothetical protein FRC04_002143 [Tulasnella sp. 424]|nr:hypothetical protein FRC04_002143 [Tulasnella sp. 424]KAG8961775.1 hypothetical protein FRC05_005801 [Tulasnella sp. 425]